MTKQSVVFHHTVKHCVTRDNVPILVRVSSMIRVLGDLSKDEDTSLVRKFVHELGVRGLEAQLVNALVSGNGYTFRGYPSAVMRTSVDSSSNYLIHHTLHLWLLPEHAKRGS